MRARMKQRIRHLFFRRPAGLCLALPFWVLIRLTACVTGRERAVRFWGPAVKTTVRWLAEAVLIPRIKGPDQFDHFCRKMKRNIFFLKPLYDITIVRHDEDILELHYHNCPHCEAFFVLGLHDIGPYCCDSDWAIAEKNSAKWSFAREMQIGTGDTVCNHTYIRKPISNVPGEKPHGH